MLKYFVTYDVALKLKDVGFDMECFAYWETGGEKPVEAFIPANATCHDFGDLRQNSFPNLVSRPLWVQVFEWFFEKYGFRKNVNRNRAGSWTWKLYDENVHGEIKVQNSGDCESEIDGYSKFVDRAIFKINNPNDFEETQMERSLRLMDEWKDSPAADKYFEKLDAEEKILKQRFERIDRYLETLDEIEFGTLMERLADEHDDDYRGKCYKKGYEPFPNNKLQLFLDYVTNRGEDIGCGNIDDNMFESSAYFFKEYYFQLSQGQGSFWRIFDINKEEFLTI